MNRWIHKLTGILFLICFFLCISTPKVSFASEVTHVTDDASIFTDTEKEELEEQCSQVSESNNIDVVILTINGTDVTRKQYIEDYYDSMDTVLSDAVILLINMDSNDPGVELLGYGSCEYTLSDDRIEAVLDDIVPYLQDGAYFDSMSEFLQEVDYYVNLDPTTTYQHTEEDNQNYNENYYEGSQSTDSGTSFAAKSLRNLAIAVVIAVVIVFIMAYNSGGRMTANQGVYLDASHSRILGQYDHYIRTTTTRVPKPKPQNNSGGGFGSGGVSSGGHSHSGGGRSF